MRLAANLSWLYPDLAWPERFAAAARDGFEGAEILLPYDERPGWYAEQLQAHGLALALINTPVEPGRGRLGHAAVPGAEADFRHGLDRAREVLDATGCRRLHVMAGYVADFDAAACRATLLRNLEHALRLAEAGDFVLTLEALNREDMPGYAYHLPRQAIEVLAQVDSPRLRLQFDGYHAMKEGLDLQAEVQAAGPWIGHVQIAGVPGRHEPDLSHHGLLEAVAALPGLGYDGWLGCEYRPRTTAAGGLAWCAPLRARGLLA